MTPDSTSSERTDPDDILRTARVRSDKVIRLKEDRDDEPSPTWFIAYRGKYGWVARRKNDDWTNHPNGAEVERSVYSCDEVELIDLSDTPEGVVI